MAITPILGARYFNSILGTQHAAPAFEYIYDSGAIWQSVDGKINSGGWRPVVPGDLASVSNVSVSGGLSVNVGSVAVTGGQVSLIGTSNVSVVNGVLPVSGAVQANVTNTAPLPFSGVVQANITNTLPINVTGIILTQVTGNIGGSVTVSSVAITGAPVVTLTGSTHVTLDAPSPVPISGLVQASIINTPSMNATIINTSYATVASALTAVTGGSITVANTAPIPISGVVQATLQATSVAVTGGQLQGGYIGITGTVNTTASVTVGAVAITGVNSGSALGNADLTHTYIPVSGVGTFNVLPLGGYVGITGTVSTNASVTVGAVAITGANSGSALGNLDVTRTYLGVSGINPFAVNATLVGGSVNVVNSGGYVAITGTANTVNVGGYVGVTGIVATNDTTGNLYLVAISGLLATNLNAYVPVTGTQLDLQRTYTGGTTPAYSFLAGGGRAVNLTGLGLATGYNTGDYAIFSINRNDGSLLTTVMNTAPVPVSGVVNVSLASVAVTGGALSGTALANLDLSHTYLPVSGINTFSKVILGGYVGLTGVATTQITGWNTGFTVTVQPASSQTTSASFPSGTAPFTALVGVTGVALNANPNRILCFVQNIHTGLPLYVLLGGAGTPGTGNFSMILNPSANLGWGGDSWSDDHFRGKVSVSGGGWQSWEI